ncbi:MAG: SWIB/MDM2 domain-containing protein [Patescibacteria group bacterium]
MPGKGSAFMKPMNVSAELAAVVGAGPMPRSEVVKKLWMYIKGDVYEDENGKKGSSLRKGPSLQDSANKRNINADENLKKVFGGKEVVNMFEMTKLVSKHLS